MAKTVAAIFEDRINAERAARQINEEGLRTEDISIIAKEDEAEGKDSGEKTGEIKDGAGPINDNISDGVVAGGVLGGLAGLLIGVGSMAIPGLGIIAAAGPVAGLLSGAVTGGIVGGLVDLGIPEKRSKQYEVDIKAGKILFSMRAEGDIDKIASILHENGAQSVDTY